VAGANGAAGAPAAGQNGTRAVTTVPPPQHAAVPKDNPGPTPVSGPAAITGYGSGRCIDVTDGNYLGNPQLQIWSCVAGSQNQRWTFYSDGTLRAYGRCMTADGGSLANGTRILLKSCDGTASQHFVLNASHDLTRSNRCVDATDQGTASGTKLQLWECGGTSNQKWH
jgi:hypothetical protein